MGLERRQPSQDFGPIIADRNVMIILHVETVDFVGKRTILRSWESAVSRRLFYDLGSRGS